MYYLHMGINKLFWVLNKPSSVMSHNLQEYTRETHNRKTRFRHWNNIAIGSCLPATPRLQRTIFVTNNQVLWGKSFTIGLLSICLVISILWHRKRVGPTTTADKKSIYRLELLFLVQGAKWKHFMTMSDFQRNPARW